MILTTNIAIVSKTSKVKAGYTSLPKKVEGPTEAEPDTYRLTEYTYKYDGNEVATPTSEQQQKFDADKYADVNDEKKGIKWVFWVEGDLMKGTKDYITISNRTQTESATDFTQETDKSKFKEAIESKGYFEATTETLVEGGKTINKLTIKFSKWLDGKKVYVEAYRNTPDHKAVKDYVATTNIKAAPEIVQAYWVDLQGKKISSTGFETDIRLYIETLGLVGETLKLELFDEDYGSGDDLLKWNQDLNLDRPDFYECTIDSRNYAVGYTVENATSPAYADAFSPFEGDLEVYVKITFEDPLIQITLEDKYAEIIFTEDETANLFFAKKETITINGDSYTQYNKIETIYPGMSAYLVAETSNLSGNILSFSVYEDSPLLVAANEKLPLLKGTTSETDFTAEIEEGGYAVVKVKFQKLDSTTYEAWNNILDNESEEGLFSKIILKAQIGTDQYASEDDFKLKSSTIRYIITPNGITKHHREISNMARYIFKNNTDDLFYIFRREFSNKKRKSKNKRGNPIDYIDYVYKKSKAQLIKISVGDSYSSGDVKFKILKVYTTKRFHIDIDCLACLLAAMIENKIEDLRFNGFSDSEGGSGISSTHWNGMVGDLGYLNTNKDASGTTLSSSEKPESDSPAWSHNSEFDYDRQVLFNESLYKYGFSKFKRKNGSVKKMLSERFVRKINSVDETKLLPHTIHLRRLKQLAKPATETEPAKKAKSGVFHYHHLHIQGLDISFFKTV